MNKYALSLTLVSAVALQACNQQSSEPAAPDAAAPAALTLESTEQRLSYGIGYNLGQRMQSDGSPWIPMLLPPGYAMLSPALIRA